MATIIKRTTASTNTTAPVKEPGALSGLATGVYTLWLKHMKKFVRSKMEIGGTLATPLLWMLLFGLCMEAIIKEANAYTRIGYEAYITPGVMLLTGLTAAILGGSTLLIERINGVIKEYLVAPIPRLAILLGTLASGLTKAIIQSLVVLAFGLLLDSSLVFNLLNMVVSLAIVLTYALGFVGIAAAFASKAKNMEGYHALIMVMNLPVLFLSNALYPLSAMPAIIRLIAYLNPTTYAVDAIRHLLYGVPLEIGLAIDIPVLIGFMALGVWYGYRCFQTAVATATN